MPLKIYDFLDEEEIRELKYRIQFIDYPGLDTKNIKNAQGTKKILMRLINGFLFTFKTDNNNSMTNSINTDILRDLLSDIRNRNQFEFSFKSCLFIMISEDNKYLDKFREELIITLNNIQKDVKATDSLKNPIAEIKVEDIQIIKFSNKLYREYLNVKESLKDYKIFNELTQIKDKDNLKAFYDVKFRDEISLPKGYLIPEESKENKD